MAIDIRSDLDLNLCQIKNFVLDKYEVNPETDLVEGRMIYNSHTKDIMLYNGIEWESFKNVNLEQMYIDENNHLIAILSNGVSIDGGQIPSSGSTRVRQTVFTNEYGEDTLTKYATEIGCTSPQVDSGAIYPFSTWIAQRAFCNAANDYVLKFDYEGSGNWSNKMDACFKTPVYLTHDSNIVLNIQQNAYETYQIRFVKVDIENPTYEDILNGTDVATAAFTGVFAQNFLTILCDPIVPAEGTTFVPGYYYVIVHGYGEGSWYKIALLDVFSDVPGSTGLERSGEEVVIIEEGS